MTSTPRSPIRTLLVDNGGNLAIRIDCKKLGGKLCAGAYIDRSYHIVEAAFLKHDRHLPSIGRRPAVKPNHVFMLQWNIDFLRGRFYRRSMKAPSSTAADNALE